MEAKRKWSQTNKACGHEFFKPAFGPLTSFKCSDITTERQHITFAIKLLQNFFGIKSNVSDRKAQNIQSFIHALANISWALIIFQAQPIKKKKKKERKKENTRNYCWVSIVDNRGKATLRTLRNEKISPESLSLCCQIHWMHKKTTMALEGKLHVLCS